MGSDRLSNRVPGFRTVRRIDRGDSVLIFELRNSEQNHRVLKTVLLDRQRPLSDREREIIRTLRSIRHPALLVVERVDIHDDHIKVVMEQAGATLVDECRRQQQRDRPGVGRITLLACLQELASCLDMLNIKYGLQHLNVRPDNMFVVNDKVKLGDACIVRANAADVALIMSSGGQRGYAAPELLRGDMSRFCDQYSLAISYVEMLAGSKPFGLRPIDGAATDAVAALAPMLEGLPEHDRMIVARALSEHPENRFGSSQEFVTELMAAGRRVSTSFLFESAAPAESELVPEEPMRGPPIVDAADAGAPLMFVENGVVGMAVRYMANMSPSMFAAKIRAFCQQWKFAIVQQTAKTVHLRRGSSRGLFSRWFGVQEAVDLHIELHQRSDTNAMVEATMHYVGPKLINGQLLPLARGLFESLRSSLVVTQAPPDKIRRAPRRKISHEIVLLPRVVGRPAVGIACTAIDISAMGLGVLSPKDLQGQRVAVFLDEHEEPMSARVVRSHKHHSGAFQLGLMFDD